MTPSGCRRARSRGQAAARRGGPSAARVARGDERVAGGAAGERQPDRRVGRAGSRATSRRVRALPDAPPARARAGASAARRGREPRAGARGPRTARRRTSATCRTPRRRGGARGRAPRRGRARAGTTRPFSQTSTARARVRVLAEREPERRGLEPALRRARAPRPSRRRCRRRRDSERRRRDDRGADREPELEVAARGGRGRTRRCTDRAATARARAMISIARALGRAGDRAAGEGGAQQRGEPDVGRAARPRTVDTRWCTRRVGLEPRERLDARPSRSRHTRPRSFRSRSTIITCSARSFASRSELGGERGVARRRRRRAAACP